MMVYCFIANCIKFRQGCTSGENKAFHTEYGWYAEELQIKEQGCEEKSIFDKYFKLYVTFGLPVQIRPSCLSQSLSSHSQNSPETYQSCGEQMHFPQ